MRDKGASRLARKRALLVVAPTGFTDHEFLQPKVVLEAEGVEVVACSTSRGSCRGSAGTVVHADLSLGEARAQDYDALIVVGGVGSREYLWHNAKLLSLLKEAQEQGRIVAAIGRARHCLANAGLFSGDFAFGPPVEVDGNIIAGRPPATTPGWSSKAFAQVVAERIRSVPPAAGRSAA